MRKMLIGSLWAALTGATAVFAVNHQMLIGASKAHLETSNHVAALAELTKERVEEFFAGKAADLVLECAEGLTIPFTLSLQGDFLALEANGPQGVLRVLRTCYIKHEGGTFFFSADRQNWKEFHEFFTGMFGVSINVDQDPPTVGVNVELNQRTPQ